MRWFYGWNVIAVTLFFQGVTIGATLSSFTFFVLPWMKEFGGSRGDILMVSFAATIVMAALTPFVGRLLDTRSIRVLACVGVFLIGAGLALLGLTTELWQVFAVYAGIIAVGLSLAGPVTAQTLAVRWFRARRGLAIGWAVLGTSIGGFALPPIVTFLMRELGWRNTLFSLAAASILMLLPPIWLVVRSSPEEKGVPPEPEGLTSDGAPTRESPVWTTRQILSTWQFWAPACVFFPMTVTSGSFMLNLAPLSDDIGISPQRAAFLVSLAMGAGVGGKLFFGAMADRWDDRAAVALGSGGMILSTVLLTGSPGYSMMLGISILIGFSQGCIITVMGAIVVSRFGASSFGRVMGLEMAIVLLAGFGAPVSGWIRDTAGTYDVAFQVFAAAMLLGLLALFRLRPPGERAPVRPAT